LAACFAVPPAGGLDRTGAEAAARRAYPEATGQLLSARAGPIEGFDPNQKVVPGDRWVWAVQIAGSFALGCGPAPPPGQSRGPCPPPA